MFKQVFRHDAKIIRLAGTACVLVLLQAGLAGCQTGRSHSDAFENGADRPPTPRTLHMMARLLNENGRTDQAEYVLLKILDENPLYLPGYIELADLQIRRQQISAAVETLTTAHALAPSDPVIANNLGVLLLREGHYARASDVFHAA
ncbi:MAG: tetratricopeptide repeat protein, partial [Phycisphaerales bacterium]|nr:tetratricopeptide repeat protein [Phycisphaerales bacterium]